MVVVAEEIMAEVGLTMVAVEAVVVPRRWWFLWWKTCSTCYVTRADSVQLCGECDALYAGVMVCVACLRVCVCA